MKPTCSQWVVPETERTAYLAQRFFVLILAGALGSSLLGGFFGAVVAAISPEFVRGIFGHDADGDALGERAFCLGMILGLFIGAGAAAFACALATLLRLLRPKQSR